MYADPFLAAGARLVVDQQVFKNQLKGVKALLFDWDGVFNSGEKGQIPSSFNEVDSMGVNMLRFGFYMLHGTLPYTAIVTGQKNPTAFDWSKREHLDNVFFHVKNKVEIVDHLESQEGIYRDEVLFVFDDILDLSLARETGIRILVQHSCNPLFLQFCEKEKLCDYITANDGASGAVREISELTLSALGLFEQIVEERIAFHGTYSSYLETRQKIETTILESVDGTLQPF